MLAHLTQERIAALKTLEERLELERQVLAEDLHRISVEVVDHATGRVALLAAFILAALFIGAVLLLGWTRRLFPPVRGPNP